MIRLIKGAIPQVLQKNAAAWTNELLQANDTVKAKSARYGHPEVKAALIAETHGKCAYCESKFGHVTYGDVEHIVAKSKNPTLAYYWTNLTVACDKCNTNKSDKDGLIDPYTDDIAVSLEFTGPWLTSVIGSDLGRVTIVVLKLNRPALMERRVERLNALRDRLEVI